jgi:pimeloyl-ACP methyl ester carboxylesterase
MRTYEQWLARGQQRVLAGRRIFFVDEGEGPTLLFLHGFPTSSLDFADVIDSLRGRHRCVALDLLGFGASEKPRGVRYSYRQQLAVILALLEALEIREFLVVAHDYSVTLGQELLQRVAERKLLGSLRGVAFLNGGLLPHEHRPLPIQRLLAGPAGPALSRLLDRSTFGRSLRSILGPGYRLDEATLDAHWQAISRDDGHQLTHELLHYMADRQRHATRLEQALLRSQIPLGFVWGEADPVSGAHVLEQLRRRLPDAEFTSFADVGHYPQIEAPGRVIEAILAFENSLEPATQA